MFVPAVFSTVAQPRQEKQPIYKQNGQKEPENVPGAGEDVTAAAPSGSGSRRAPLA